MDKYEEAVRIVNNYIRKSVMKMRAILLVINQKHQQ